MQEAWALCESGLCPSLTICKGSANASIDFIQSRKPMGLMVVLMIFAVALPTKAAVNIQKQHINGLPKTAYANGVGKPSMIVLHEAANNSATIENEVSYMSRNWQNAFVHAFASASKVIEIVDTNYTAWGAAL
ncbi:hypothetical protein [Listeria grandensis]|uniref:hypothetical protein n=1 Tax=Listeria grandensis TaxID=1494963 RepID=UPI00164EB99B|nr:hypothetical protein [Listeria grandensis]MBC6316747.1 hypothetical protein [Listeria grandensis]